MDSVDKYRDFLDALEELVRQHRAALDDTQEIDLTEPDVFDWVDHVRKQRA